MTKINKLRTLLARYKSDERGSMAIAYSCSLLTLVIAIGAGYDLANVSNADHKAQNVADAAALTAAVFVSHNDRAPTSSDEGYMNDTVYSARAEGHAFPGSVHPEGTTGAPKVTVSYDFDKGMVTAKVKGKTSPAFLKMFGRTELDFEETSEVAFMSKGYKSPATVFVAVDGSGSMAWDDIRDTDPSDDETSSTSTTPGAQARMDGLKSSLLSFMKTLKEIPGDTTQVLRTGMYVYTHNYESSRSHEEKWGILNRGQNGKIKKLYAGGGTNASKALEEIRKDMEDEGRTHEKRNGNNTPLKFVILMTDGVNSPTGKTNCRNEGLPAHQHWEARYWNNKTKRMVNDQSESRFMPKHGENWVQVDVAEGEEIKWVCDDVSNHDTTTKSKCDTLAGMGVTIHTIAYGLETGRYHTRENKWQEYEENNGFIYDGYHIELPQATRDRAYGVMQYCATVGGGSFVPAEDADQLTAAFEGIGEEIVEEVIRIMN